MPTPRHKRLATQQKDTWRVALQTYEDAMAAPPKLPTEVMNSQKTRQRMIALKRASDDAWNAFYKAKAAERKAFERLAS